MSVIKAQTLEDLKVVARFFDIDLDANLHLFRATADASGDAFERFLTAMAKAVRSDRRFGINERIPRRVPGHEIYAPMPPDDAPAMPRGRR